MDGAALSPEEDEGYGQDAQDCFVESLIAARGRGFGDGVNGGYGFGQQTPGSLFGGDFSAFNYNANGWLGGLTAGAQLQNGQGVQMDLQGKAAHNLIATQLQPR